MDKYNENILLKTGILINVVFLCIIICIYTGFRIDFSDIFKNKEVSNKNKPVVNQDSEAIFSDDKMIEAVIEGKIECILPGGVSKANCSVKKDIFNKKIIIAFPKGMGEYKTENIVSDYSLIQNVDISISDVMVKIEIRLNAVRDCNIKFEDGKLLAEFFNPVTADIPVIVIDAGHGGDDVGAIENGIYEKNINLAICEKLKDLLDNDDRILVYYTRQDDTFPSVEERVDFVNELMPDLFISIHSNWYESASTSGTSVLYNVKDKSEYGSEWLSNILCQEIVNQCNTVNRGVINGNDIHIVRHSAVPVALIETGFMSNEEDFKLLCTEVGQSSISRAVYEGIIRALTELGKY